MICLMMDAIFKKPGCEIAAVGSNSSYKFYKKHQDLNLSDVANACFNGLVSDVSCVQAIQVGWWHRHTARQRSAILPSARKSRKWRKLCMNWIMLFS